MALQEFLTVEQNAHANALSSKDQVINTYIFMLPIMTI